MLKTGLEEHDHRRHAVRRGSLGVSLMFATLFHVAQTFAGDGDPVAGERLFGLCKGCHEIGEGARNKVGPHLDGIIGRKAGSIEGFTYSRAMRQAGQAGLVWDAANLSTYLQKPRDFIAGNRMSFRGLAGETERADLVAYLAATGGAAPADDLERRDAVIVTGFAKIVLDMEGDRDYGEYLAGECVTCHQASGHADGIPSIVGVPRAYFVKALFEYKSNIRTNEVMKLRVANLANEDIAALAAYFSSLEPE